MPPFTCQILVEGIKERVESIISHGDRVFLGTNTGNLLIYSLDKAQDGSFHATLEEVKGGLTRRSIEQLGFIKDTYTLISLYDGAVNLHPLPALTPTQTLLETRGALCFALDTSVIYTNEDGTTTTVKDPTLKQVPAVVTLLAVGCKRRIVIYSWKDGEIQNPPQEVNLPHSPRAIAFPTSKVVAMAYTQTDHALLYLDTRSVAEVVLPNTLHPSSSTGLTGAMGMGMNAISGFGLGGYMTLGLGAKSKPSIIKTAEGEFVIPKETSTVFLGADGKPSRKLAIEWPATPEETALAKPYLLSILPGTATQTGGVPNQTPNPVLQARSSLTLSVAQTISYPFGVLRPSRAVPPPQYSLRLLSPSSTSTAPLFLISAPNDRTNLATEGSTLWMFNIQPWSTQIDELVADCKYSDAFALLESLEDGILPDKIKRRAHIQALHGVALIAQKHFEAAFEIFLNLDLNPAKIIAMYPVEISGRLSKPESSWIELFGEKSQNNSGTSPLLEDTEPGAGSANVAVVGEESGAPEGVTPEPSGPKLNSKSKEYRDAVDRLLEYLTQRRQKIKLALSAINIMSSDAAKTTRLSEASVDEIMILPDAPPTALTPEQLFKFAQIVDTALFKSYLAVKPGLIGPLCRLDNWCEVSEVQNELRARGKFTELKFLYQGKRMHSEALALLKDLGEKETDLDEQLDPTVAYLQNLGSEYLPIIFEGAEWVLKRDKNKGFHIFTSEEHVLPKNEVADFLQKIDPMVSIRFLEFLIDEKKETDSSFHDRLGDLYLRSALSGDLPSDAKTTANNKFISFLVTSKYYHPDHLLASLPHDDMLEARAILLGRLGDHKAALSIYVYDLQNFVKAEEYCKQLHFTNPNEQGVYMMLLRLYLLPEDPKRSRSSQNQYLQPALDLISKHSPRLDAVETLQLLPPLVTASSVQEYLCEALRTPRIHVRFERELWKARSEQVSQILMTYESKRVKIADSRLCPQCHKRLDRAAIAVHAPRGEVTHYHCREAFSAKLKGKERILQPTVL
ncbi:Vacuolar morphogenesis protein 6 [Serendipita sp. 400]|nr:Vacuolar morphogenesis protein 6 [Serendipita sp. 400]